MQSTLIVGPWIGEYGWQLCQWQGYARRVAREANFDRVLVCTYPGEGHLGIYQDFATDFVPLPAWFLAAGYEPDVIDAAGCTPDCHAALVRDVVGGLSDYVHITPHRIDLSTTEQDWADWARDTVIEKDRLVLVKRKRDFDPERNWPESHWAELENRLRAEGFDVVFMEKDWERSLALFSSCRLAVGGSTGGMHLASLCKCPHLVWGDHGMANLTDRYTTTWNPHNTPCRVLTAEGWTPSIDSVMRAIRESLSDIAR